MATLTCALGRVGARKLFSPLRLGSNLPDLSHAVRSQLMSPAKWYLNAFTPCQNCRNYFSTKQLIFKPREFLPRNVRRFIKRSDKGQGSSGLSKLNRAPVHVGNGGRSLVRPFFFTLGVCGVSFTGAMIWQYETMRYHAQKPLRPNPHTEHIDLRKFGFREHIGSMWNGLSRGQKMVAGIIGANFLVFLMWRVPVLTPFMTTYFCSSPVSGAPCVSMVLSQFSHINFFHLAANMYVLWSFSSVALSLLGKEQFMALYLSAGTVSCFSSYVLKVARKSFTPSVGASGALMAVLGAVCVSYPDARLAVAFIGDLFPHSFSADTAMKALIAVDTTGLVLGWKLFDHAAHLGGMLFGILYMKFGRDLIWGNREPVMEAWHKLRGKP